MPSAGRISLSSFSSTVELESKETHTHTSVTTNNLNNNQSMLYAPVSAASKSVHASRMKNISARKSVLVSYNQTDDS